MSKYTEAFGKELYSRRADAGLSLRKAAVRADLNPNTIMALEKGGNAKMSTYEALAAAYGVDFDVVLRGVMTRLT